MDASQTVSDTLTKSLDGFRAAASGLATAFRSLNNEQVLDSRIATKFILSWMRDLTYYHKQFGELINRSKRPPIADDFTASVAIALREFLTARGHENSVYCEKPTHRSRGATRPDISVLDGRSQLLATIECKTNFGWNRKGWQIAFETRENALKKLFPNCTSYLCIMTKINWDSSELDKSNKLGTSWFCLCNDYIGRLRGAITDENIFTPIEPLFVATLEKLENRKGQNS